MFDTLAAVEPEVDEGFDVRGGALEAAGLRTGWPITQPTVAGRASLWSAPTAADGDATAAAIAAADGDGA